MRIAIGTNDKKTLNPAHFGESRYFCVVETLMGRAYTVECRENPWPGHGIPGKSHKVVGLLDDCDAIVARKVGREAFKALPAKRKDLYLTSLTDLDEIIRRFSRGGLTRFRKYDPTRARFRSCATAIC